MSSQKFLLGTLALAGGAYYYDQNVQQIFPRQQHLDKGLNKVDNKQRELSKKLTGKLDDAKKELKSSPSLTEKIKESDLYQNFNSDVKEYKKSVEYELTPQKDKNIFARGIDAYIDTVNRAGQSGETHSNLSTVSRRTEVKEKPWFGWFRSDESKAKKQLDETKANAENKKDEWFSWGSQKKEEAKKDADRLKSDAESKKNEWFSWGSKKSDELSKEASNRYESAKKELDNKATQTQSTVDSTKKQLSDTVETGKQEAIRAYESAKARVEELTEQLKTSTEPDKNEKLRLAREDLYDAFGNLKSYGKDTYNDVNSSIKDTLKR